MTQQVLFDSVDNLLKDPLASIESAISVITKLTLEAKQEAEPQTFEAIGCSRPLGYVLDRLTKALCSNSIEIKQNAAYSLGAIANQLLLQDQTPDAQNIFANNLINHVLKITDHRSTSNKHQTLKKTETTSMLIGRILALRSLATLIKQFASDKVITVLAEEMEQEDLQEPLLEVFSLITSKKKYVKTVESIQTKSPSINAFKKCVIAKLTGTPSLKWDSAEIQEIFDYIVQRYPQESSIVDHLVQSMDLSKQEWHKLWSDLIAKYVSGAEENKQADSHHSYKGIYLILSLLKCYAARPQTEASIQNILHADLLELWFTELNVLNKKCRTLASSIEINVGNNEALALTFLQYLHRKDIAIGNIQNQHPLQNVYKVVNPNKYIEYMLHLLEQTAGNPQDEEDESVDNWICQLYGFMKITQQEVSKKNYLKVAEVLLKRHRRELAGQKFLQMIWSLVNIRVKKNSSLKHVSNSAKGQNKAPVAPLHPEDFQISLYMTLFQKFHETDLSLQKVTETKNGSSNNGNAKETNEGSEEEEYEELPEVSQNRKALIRSFEFLKKVQKDNLAPETHSIIKTFLEFYASTLVFNIVTQEETETAEEMEMVAKDLLNYVSVHLEGKQAPNKKKKKKQVSTATEEEDIKKPIHVLVDIFIAYLTKAPSFLRESLEKCFEALIGQLDESDLTNLIAALTRPDNEYLEEVQEE